MKKIFTVILLATLFRILSPLYSQWTNPIIDPKIGNPAIIDVGDIDGDGDLDAIVTGWNANRIVWYENPIITGIQPLPNVISSEFILSQNYPNPFNPSTTIEFSIPKSGFVTLKIFNLLGEKVVEPVSERLTMGGYKFEWCPVAELASGVYLYRLEAGEYVETRKMVLIR